MTKKIAMSGLSIMAALVMMGGATFAVFNDSATATGNTFAVGTADLQIAVETGTGPGVFAATIPGPTFNGIVPGQTKTFDFWLKNASTSAVALDLVADVTAITNADDSVDQIDNTLLVSWTCDTDLDNSLANNVATAAYSPRDWLNGGNTSVGSLPANTQMFCRMHGALPTTADNTVAGETVSFDVQYDATQVVAP